MESVPDLDAQARLNATTIQANASTALRTRGRRSSRFLDVFNVACTSLTVGLLAIRGDDFTRAMLVAVAGAALVVAAMAYGEVGALRRRVDALIVLQDRSP